MAKKVLIVHYRTGERDGVGLEIEKRAHACRRLGAEVKYLTGFDAMDREQAIVIPELDLKHPEAIRITELAFPQDTHVPIDVEQHYQTFENSIYAKLKVAFQNYRPDVIFIHNFFSLPYNLPATTALLKIFDELQIPLVTVNHDFWFEREKFSNTPFPFIQSILNELPPKRSYVLKHQVINSLAEKELLQRRGITAEKIGDYFDFSQPGAEVDTFNQDLEKTLGIRPHDLVVLQATRITERKAIENSIYFVHYLNQMLKETQPFEVKGKKITSDSHAFLLLSNFVMHDAVEYAEKLKSLAEKLEIPIRWGDEYFALSRSSTETKKTYSFWDAYAFAHLITYPSILEGFGNQFLEAMFFKLPIVVYEYPVFESDIKGEGYYYISLGNETKKEDGMYLVPAEKIKQAAAEALRLLQSPTEMSQLMEKNFEIGKGNHDEKLLLDDMETLLQKVGVSEKNNPSANSLAQILAKCQEFVRKKLFGRQAIGKPAAVEYPNE